MVTFIAEIGWLLNRRDLSDEGYRGAKGKKWYLLRSGLIMLAVLFSLISYECNNYLSQIVPSTVSTTSSC